MPKEKISINPKEVRKILIINLGGIGDFLLSTPALKALRNHFKDAQIVFLAVPRTASMARDSEYLDEVLTFDFKLFPALSLLLKLRARRFDLALNMRTIESWGGALKMAAIFHIIRPQYKVGRDTVRRGFFFDLKIPESALGDMPEYAYDLKTIGALGIEAEYTPMEIIISEADISYINNFLTINKVKEKDMVIGINPGATLITKCWPTENFAQVIRILSQEFRCKIIITGSLDELEIAKKLQRLSNSELIIATGKTSIKQLAALIKRCALYITNDNGSMHIASILKIPLVAIFGAGYLKRFDPRNISQQAIALHKALDCAPCNRKRCKSLKCLKSISPEEVAEAAIKCLKKFIVGFID